MTAKTPEEKAAFAAKMKAAKEAKKSSSGGTPAMRTVETVVNSKPAAKPASKPKSKTPPKEKPAEDEDDEPGLSKFFL